MSEYRFKFWVDFLLSEADRRVYGKGLRRKQKVYLGEQAGSSTVASLSSSSSLYNPAIISAVPQACIARAIASLMLHYDGLPCCQGVRGE